MKGTLAVYCFSNPQFLFGSLSDQNSATWSIWRSNFPAILIKKKNPQFFNKKSPRLKFICSSIDNSQFLNWKSPNWFFGQKFPSLELRVHLWPSTKPPRHLSKPRQALPSLDKPCVTKPLWTSIEFWKYCRRASLLFFLLSVDSRYPSVILLLFSKILIF